MEFPVRQVSPGAPQLSLFGESVGADADGGPPPEPEACTRFVDPPPGELRVGPTLLYDYLVETEATDVLAIRRFVRGLDMTEFAKAYVPRGRAPYHPALMISLILYALAKGVSSLRKIEELARWDARVWWLTGGACPDHTTLCRFLIRHEDLLAQDFFVVLAKGVVELTGADASDVAIDGTTIASMATRYQLLTAEAAEQKSLEAREAAEAASNEQEAARLTAKAAKLEQVAEVSRERTEVRKRDRGRKCEEVKVAPADPDATYQKLKDGTYAPSHKPVIAATKERIVVGFDVQTSCESDAVPRILDQAAEIAGQPVQKARADSGFRSGHVIQDMLDRGVEEPLISERAVAEGVRRKKSSKRRMLPRSEFRYDGATDTYRCPAGETLRLKATRKRKNPQGTRTRILRTYGGAPCDFCVRRPECTEAKGGRSIVRGDSADLLEAMAHVMSYPDSVRDYRQRAAMVEPVFADLHQQQGFRRLRRAGKRVRLEVALHLMAHNLGRLLRLLPGLHAALLALLRALWVFAGALRALATPGSTRQGAPGLALVPVAYSSRS